MQGTEFQRAAALLSVLQSFVARGVSPSDSAAAQQRQLHLALLLAAQQLSRTAAARSRDGAADGSRPAAGGAAGEMQQAYSGLLRLALDQLQVCCSCSTVFTTSRTKGVYYDETPCCISEWGSCSQHFPSGNSSCFYKQLRTRLQQQSFMPLLCQRQHLPGRCEH